MFSVICLYEHILYLNNNYLQLTARRLMLGGRVSNKQNPKRPKMLTYKRKPGGFIR